MNKIGEGFYYNVYDLGNERVEKRLTSYRSRLRKIIIWGGTAEFGLRELMFPWIHKRRLRQSINASKQIARVIGESLLGNPTFFNKYEYSQDKATVLLEYFKNSTSEDALIFVKNYVEFVHLLWMQGYSDTVFNFTFNYGISEKNRKFICLDFNEFTNSKEKVILDIEKKKWKTQASLRDFPRELDSLKEKIVEIFDLEFTKEKLGVLWATKG